MKKIIRGILIIVMMIIAFLPKSVYATDETGGISSPTDGGEKLYMAPNEDQLSDLQVGDNIHIGQDEEWNTQDNLKSLEVVTGQELVTVTAMESYDEKTWWKVSCKKPGEVRLKVEFQPEYDKLPKEIEFNIQEKKQETKVTTTTKSVKLGSNYGNIAYKFENLPLGSLPFVFIDQKDADNWYIHVSNGGWGGWFETWKRESVEPWYIYWNAEYEMLDIATWALYPGKMNVKCYLSEDDYLKGNEPIMTFPLTIEDPVIKTNEKAAYQSGESLVFQSSLTNTGYEDIAIKSSEDENPSIYYTPKLEIVSGAECCEFIGKQSVTTLSLNQNIKFKKNGIVKLKITYVPSGIDASKNKVYQPEKTVTIQVGGKNDSTVEGTGYSIKYKLNGGKNNSGNPNRYYKQTVSLKNPVKKGYAFKGWYKDKKYKKKITKIAPKYKKNLTLYAKWERIRVGKSTVTKLKNNTKGNAVLKFKGVKKAKGYEVLYGTNKKLKKGSERISTKSKYVKLTELKKKKTYYVKVRAYRIDSAGKKVYGKYSSVKKVRIKK